MSKSELPTVVVCAICEKQVERLEIIEMADTKLTHVVAYCHGDVDRMTMDPTKLTREQLKSLKSTRGLAFATQRLENETDDPQRIDHA